MQYRRVERSSDATTPLHRPTVLPDAELVRHTFFSVTSLHLTWTAADFFDSTALAVLGPFAVLAVILVRMSLFLVRWRRRW